MKQYEKAKSAIMETYYDHSAQAYLTRQRCKYEKEVQELLGVLCARYQISPDDPELIRLKSMGKELVAMVYFEKNWHLIEPALARDDERGTRGKDERAALTRAAAER